MIPAALIEELEARLDRLGDEARLRQPPAAQRAPHGRR
jgi:hypothetical protein